MANNEHKSAHRIWSAGFSLATAASLILTGSSACVAQNAPAPVVAAAIPNALGSVSRSASDGKMLHVLVGHSIFVDTKTRLRRVYVADPAVLNSVTLTPNEIIVTAMNPGISSLTLLDEAGDAQSYVVSSDLDIEGLRAAMSQAAHAEAIKIEGVGGRVTLTGTVASPEISDAAAKLAGLYAKDVVNALTVAQVHPRQVRLEVRILEVDRAKALQLGINLFSPAGNTNFLAQTTTSQYPSSSTYTSGGATAGALGTLTTSNPLNFLLYSAKLNLGATIQDLQTKQVLQILAEPTITTMSGQKADFLSGGEFPFPTVQPGGSGGTPVVSISFRPFGVKVEFTPTVNEDGTIRLKVMPEVSALDYTNAVSISGFTVPALSTRRADTEVELRSNQSFAISGLLDQRTTDIMNKIPGAASIPVLGYLFKSKNVNHSTTELIVVVTPTVVDPLTENTEPAQPDLPIKTLDPEGFDKALGKNLNPQPAAPPIIPDRPPMGNLAPQPPAPAPTAPTAQTTAPDSTPAPIAVTPAAAPVSAPTAVTPAAAPVSVPAAAPLVAPLATPAATPAHAAPASAGSHSAETATAQTGTVVEVMALSHESDAEAMVAALNRHGYNVAVNHEAKDSLLHLDVGPFGNAKDADAVRERLLLDGYNPTIK